MDMLIQLLIFTIIIEFIVYVIAIRKNIKNLLLYAVLINAFTLPIAYVISGILGSLFLFLIEFFVFLIEFVLIMLLFRIKWWKALVISFIANLITTIISGILGFGLVR